jgi:hypothetical protein
MLPACHTPGDLYELPPFELTPDDIEDFVDELRRFHARFRHCFERSEPRDHFFRYMMGQFSALERKSIAPIALQRLMAWGWHMDSTTMPSRHRWPSRGTSPQGW